MPKGKHKGGKRCFTNFDELQEQKLKEQKEKEWRKARGEDSDSDEEDEEKEKKSSDEEESGSEEESGDDESRKPKAKGISGLIEIENPNHVTQKMKKLTTIDNPATATATATAAAPPTAPPTATSGGKAQLSRKEREELDRQRASANYRRLHAQGKTDEAKADLERLALIRKQREEAQKRRDDEKKAKEEAAAAKKEKVAKALNKKEVR